MKILPNELHERQKWTLNQKIDHALGAIEQFYNHVNGKCVVMFSGGKDSTVLLHLVRRLYPNTPAIFINTTNEFSEIIRFVKSTNDVVVLSPKVTFKQTVEKYGFPLISKKVAKAIQYIKYPSEKTLNVRNLIMTGYNSKGVKCSSYKLAKKWYFLKDVPFDITYKCCNELKHKPFEEYQKNIDVHPFVGTMADNSQQRKGNYLKFGCNILDTKKPKSRPLSIWNDNDIWNYIKEFNVPYCDIYDNGETNTGCAYCAFGCHLEKESRFKRLKEREPKRFELMMNLTNNNISYKEALEMLNLL